MQKSSVISLKKWLKNLENAEEMKAKAFAKLPVKKKLTQKLGIKKKSTKKCPYCEKPKEVFRTFKCRHIICDKCYKPNVKCRHVNCCNN